MVVLQCPQVDWQVPTQAVNLGIKNILKNPFLNQLNVRKPLVVSISQKRDDLKLYSLV
jgi:hypothetical protein